MKNKFRLIVKDYNGDTAKFESEECHQAKATAGRLLHVESIQYACVAGVSGRVYFYLDKEDYSTKINISSQVAEIAEKLAQAEFMSILSGI